MKEYRVFDQGTTDIIEKRGRFPFSRNPVAADSAREAAEHFVANWDHAPEWLSCVLAVVGPGGFSGDAVELFTVVDGEVQPGTAGVEPR